MVTIFLSEPDRHGCELREAHDVCGQLVLSGGNAPELLDLLDEAVDSVTCPIDVFAVGASMLAVTMIVYSFASASDPHLSEEPARRAW
ncbi:hypothetical protein [Lichenibacterium dinghuense]|uniref:hypothetical protein n=1 Tax=Lichenibacterium dinghuense TaxID=2895977 RepID=UPI001F46C5F6|nr:hypothetical protein [Lichenibacterium sp. 6Y81]